MIVPLDVIWSVEPTRFARWVEERARVGGAPRDSAPLSVTPEYDGSVAIVPISGVLTRYGDALGMSTDALTRALRALRADAATTAVVLRIDSPGGSVDGLAELTDEVAALAAEKPVIAQVDGMAASAAYQIASQAREIHATRMSLVGSIGTRMLLYDVSQALSSAGIRTVAVTTGKYKAAGAPGVPITAEHEQYFAGIVALYQRDFADAVQRGRRLNAEQLARVSDGRLFGVEEARALGLLDGVRSMDATLASLQVAGVPRPAARGVRLEVVTMDNKTSDAVQPVAATVAELEALPGATPEFVLGALKAELTLPQATESLLREMQRKVQEAERRPAAAAVVSEDAIAGRAAVEEPSPMAQARTLSRERGIPLLNAMRKLAFERPELIDALLDGR